MNKYKAFHKGRELEIEATSSYGAQRKAAEILKVKETKRHEITIVLCEKFDGMEVIHVATN